MTKMTRREAREQAFAIVFEYSFHNDGDIASIIDSAQEARTVEVDDFASRLSVKVEKNLVEIDEKIEKYAIGWRKSRISKVALAILRMAICEMLFVDDIPVSVSINEAVELAKKYASEEEAAFINGVLGSVFSNKSTSENSEEGE